VKLPFASAEQARHALGRLGGTLLKGRRLQDDRLLDTPADELKERRCALRVRMEGPESRLTFKGPVQPGPVKAREELETPVGDGALMLRILGELSYRPWFRYQKYREEYSLPDLVAAIDETPIGVYVELEGTEAAIEDAAARLGRTRADYVLDSYFTLFQRWRDESGSSKTHMVFDA
jgi:adenylate cyclase class 2